MPKPSTLRKTPLLALASIRRTRSPWSVTPTLKSPSVARMTRLRAVLDEVLRRPCRRRAGCPRRRWSSRRPAAGRSRRGSRPCRAHEVERQHQARGPRVDDDRHPVVLAELLDQRPQRPTSPAAACSGLSIEPETSIRKTRLLGGRPVVVDRPGPSGRSAPAGASAFQGQPATSTWTANGASPVGRRRRRRGSS